MPKLIPKAVKARAVALLFEGRNASQTAATIAEEFPGQTLSVSLVAQWAKANKIHLPEGRPLGHPGAKGKRGPGPKTSKHRARVLELAAAGMSQAEIGRTLDISRQLVHALLRN